MYYFILRGVSGYLKLGGQLISNLAAPSILPKPGWVSNPLPTDQLHMPILFVLSIYQSTIFIEAFIYLLAFCFFWIEIIQPFRIYQPLDYNIIQNLSRGFEFVFLSHHFTVVQQN